MVYNHISLTNAIVLGRSTTEINILNISAASALEIYKQLSLDRQYKDELKAIFTPQENTSLRYLFTDVTRKV